MPSIASSRAFRIRLIPVRKFWRFRPATKVITVCALTAFLALIAASHGYAQSVCPPRWVCPADPIYQSTIGIWYTIWWQRPNEPHGDHWREWSRYRPVLGYYRSGDPAVIQAHVRAMKNAGIDYLVLDHTNGMDNDDGAIDRNAQALFATISSLPPAEQLPVALAIGFQLWGGHSLEGQNAEAQRVWADYARQPIYFRWQGKPLLITYNAYDTPDVWAPNWTDPRFTVRRATGIVDTANSLLSRYERNGYWGWVQREPTPINSEAMGVMPGWETAHLGRQTTPIDREDGRLYQREWLHAMANNPQTIVITGWNDFAEEVAIEPAYADGAPAWRDSYGMEVADWYLQITTAYAQLRTGLAEDTYYHDEDSVAVYRVAEGQLIYQSEPPHGQPVIALPAGTISALQHAGAGWRVLKGSGPDLFMILDGQRRLVGAEEQLSLYQVGTERKRPRRYVRAQDLRANLGFSDYQTVDDEVLASIPQGTDIPLFPSRLVSSPTSGTIYYLDHGIKCPVTPADIIPFGLDAAGVVSIADDLLDALPTGPRLQWPLKASGREDIYLAGSGRGRRIARKETLHALGYDESDVRTVSDRDLAAYQMAADVPAVASPVLQRPDGTLYLLQHGSKRRTTRAQLSLFGITATPEPMSDEVVDAFPSSIAMSGDPF